MNRGSANSGRASAYRSTNQGRPEWERISRRRLQGSQLKLCAIRSGLRRVVEHLVRIGQTQVGIRGPPGAGRGQGDWNIDGQVERSLRRASYSDRVLSRRQGIQKNECPVWIFLKGRRARVYSCFDDSVQGPRLGEPVGEQQDETRVQVPLIRLDL